MTKAKPEPDDSPEPMSMKDVMDFVDWIEAGSLDSGEADDVPEA